MHFQLYNLHESFEIRNLISFHYHEFAKGFSFAGEEHDFWELCYVDKGEVQVLAYNRLFFLKPGEIIFYKPHVFHNISTLNNTAPNLVNLCFSCVSPHMHLFEERSFRLNDQECKVLSEVVEAGLHAFDPPIDTTTLDNHSLRRNENSALGSEQLIKIGLEKLLILLSRRASAAQPAGERRASTIRENREDQLFAEITAFLDASLAANFDLISLSVRFQLGKSQLKKLFKDKTGLGIKQYWNRLKFARAKIMIREEDRNITQIADLLGYGSVHYFSRRFKQETGMTPTEYAKSIKARALQEPGSN